MSRRRPTWVAGGLAALAIVFFGATTPDFLSAGNLRALLNEYVAFGLASLAFGIVIFAGEFDLSFPAVATVAGILALKVGAAGMYVGIAAGVMAGAAIGAFQGLAIERLKISSIVFTLGSMLVIQGVAYIISHQGPVASPDLVFATTLQESLWVFSPAIVIALAVFAIVAIGVARTRVGRDLMAIGGARSEAIASGVSVRRTLCVAFAMSGALAGLTGGLVAGESGGISATSFDGLLILAITGVLIGGVSLTGGRGSVGDIALGVLALAAVQSGLNLNGAAEYVTSLAIAGVLMIMISFNLLADSRAARRGLEQVGRAVAASIGLVRGVKASREAGEWPK